MPTDRDRWNERHRRDTTFAERRPDPFVEHALGVERVAAHALGDGLRVSTRQLELASGWPPTPGRFDLLASGLPHLETLEHHEAAGRAGLLARRAPGP